MPCMYQALLRHIQSLGPFQTTLRTEITAILEMRTLSHKDETKSVFLADTNLVLYNSRGRDVRAQERLLVSISVHSVLIYHRWGC